MHRILIRAKTFADIHKVGAFAIIASVVFSEVAVVVTDLVFTGEISRLCVIRAFVIPLAVSTILVAIATRFFDHLRLTETALRRSEAENQAFLAALPDLMFQISLDGTFLEYYAAHPEILWLPPEDFLGKSIYDVLPQPSADRIMTYITAAAQTHEIQRYEYQLPYKSAPRYYEARLVPLHEDRVLAIIRDITPQKEAEKALKVERASLVRRVDDRTAALRAANVQLIHALQIRDEFMSNVSHELRTPLTAILAFTDLLQRQLYGPLNVRQAKAVSNVKDSAQHLLELINNILDISKIESGALALNIGAVDVKRLFQDSLHAIENVASNKNLTVNTYFDNQVSTIPADALRLKQALTNLLSNAVKFTPEGGAIGLEVHGDIQTDVVRFTVWDTGIGIAADDFSRIFKPFIQLDHSLTREYEGSGLGLALVEYLVEMHGGAIIVESEIGKGSRFTISLPWSKPKSNQETKVDAVPEIVPLPVTSPSPAAQPLILVAEDNPFNREALCDLLHTEGFRTITAPDGAAAIRATREQHPDLILMDIQMPGMDGLETTRRIRADTELKDTPVIAVTALAMPGDRDRCLAAGANRYVSKPIDADRLLNLIGELLNQGDATP